MKMEVEIISKECIQPSSPTPHHLKTHKLSLLDLHAPVAYFPLVLYYPLNQETNLSPTGFDHSVSIRLQLLKQSLSETLSLFYPFAGEIKDDFDSVECNDKGVYFVSAQVKTHLCEFLNHPDNVLITSKFLPDDGKWLTAPTAVNYVLGVQVTTFGCGGIVIGVVISHIIADGNSLSSFLKGWAIMARKNIEEAIRPKFDAWSLFPRNDAYPRKVCSSIALTSSIKFDKYVTRRFVFDAAALANLKAKAKSSSVQNPTRVEVVTALLSKCIMSALKVRSDSDKPFILTHTVNLRRKATPPISEYNMGNFVWRACALCKHNETELCGLVSKLREAIAKLNGDFVNSLQGEGGLLNFLDALKYEGETCTSAADNIAFSSWCKFGFYDIDFGWGKPFWASIFGVEESTYFRKFIVLMDTRAGNGIEAWVYLGEEDMARLQLDKELLEFASMDPSPL